MKWSIPYTLVPKPAYWGSQTSTINWCEEDYLITSYTAEFINSTTNAIFVALALRGMYNCVKQGHDIVFFVTFLGYLVIGLGSLAFHSTLWCKLPPPRPPYQPNQIANHPSLPPDSMQLVDELSMINTTLIMYVATFAYGRSLLFSTLLALSLTAFSVAISLIYHHLQDPRYHQNAYAILTAIVLGRSIYLVETQVKGKYQAAYKDLWRMAIGGLLFFGAGFTLWTLDRELCAVWRGLRRSVGLPWGFVLEGHGWWHLLTGLGGYYYIVYGIYLRRCLNGDLDEYELVWPSYFTSLPSVMKKPGVKRHGMLRKTNGAAAGKNGARKID
ncbi:alkaline phytoceramidase [Ascobolus immersus RN42]|uniref:Alkaline phytoceramidase n=1 Tax=Ascobolus immersus RN42 TaxID=1160509 RepID=A0A3N4ILX7_ASCIM|nr:alkaline phytoceramidase [Ascobolus immersus RN42]